MNKNCQHCGYALTDAAKVCPECGFPCNGNDKDILRYKLSLIDLQNWLTEAGKSIRGLLSLAMFFLFLFALTGLYALLFRQASTMALLIFSSAAALYFSLYRLARRQAYPALLIALLLYMAHTLFEFQIGLVPAEAEGMKGQGIFGFVTLLNKALPFIYVVFRIALTVVIGRGVWLYIKIRRYPPQMVRWAERHPAET